MRRLFTTAAVAVGIFVVASAASAGTWDEATDGGGNAGQTIGTAQATIGIANPLTAITGAIGNGTSIGLTTDIDIFCINIPDLNLFTASTDAFDDNLGGDTALFLFDSTGKGIIAHDDITATNLRSTLSGAGLVGSGTFYLAITHNNNEPIDSLDQLIFPGGPDGTGQVAANPAAGVLDDWGGDNPLVPSPRLGRQQIYRIDLTGANFAFVPEPTTMVLFGLGGLGVAAYTRRRKQQGDAGAEPESGEPGDA